MNRLLMLILLLPLAACQTPGPLDENSPYWAPPPGSLLILNQTISVPAHSATVVLQGGRVVSGKDIKRYHPHCRLEVHRVSDTPQMLQPDEFVVRRSHQDASIAWQEGPLLVANRVRVGSDGPTFYIYKTILELQSARQPQVRWMTCEQWGDPSTGQHVTIHEIRNALGDMMRLVLPATPST